jgi:hypothetical protein
MYISPESEIRGSSQKLLRASMEVSTIYSVWLIREFERGMCMHLKFYRTYNNWEVARPRYICGNWWQPMGFLCPPAMISYHLPKFNSKL